LRSGFVSQGSGNIFIGYEAGYNEAGSNRMYISNSNADANNALLYGEFDNQVLRDKPCIGFIAQEVEPIFPELVTPPTNDGKRETPYMMNYAGFGVLAIKAIQEQQEILDLQIKVNLDQQAIIDAQEERISKLEALVQQLLEKK
jgi:hypothetical protein